MAGGASCLLPGREAMAAILVSQTELQHLNNFKWELARMGLGWLLASVPGAMLIVKDPRKQGNIVARRVHGIGE